MQIIEIANFGQPDHQNLSCISTNTPKVFSRPDGKGPGVLIDRLTQQKHNLRQVTDLQPNLFCYHLSFKVI